MDGRNSIGRKVSLLNDESHSTFAVLPRLPPLSVFSRSPSLASSSPSLSPQTPRLVRSESSDSRSALPPSPLTPPFPSSSFDHLHHNLGPLYLGRSLAFPKMDDSSASIYPPIPETSGVAPYPMPVLPSANSASASTIAPPVQAVAPSASQVFRSSQSPVSESAHLPASSAKPTTKKNQYPCPLAKHFGCNDYFTTSGHAARHAKKHTGKKDAFCPECNKAFTRKDNMEQHRRTHQNIRGPSKSSTDSRVRKTTKQPSSRKSISGPLEAAAVAQLEEQQSRQQQQQQPSQSIMSSTPYYISSEPVQPLPQPMGADFGPRPTLYRSSFPSSLDFMPAQAQMISDPDLHYSYPSPGLSNGLDTLALAASDHRRTSEESS